MMKIKFLKIKLFAVAAIFLLGMQPANAQMQIYGWHGSITFMNTTNGEMFDKSFIGYTRQSCELSRDLHKTYFVPPNWVKSETTVESATACIPWIYYYGVRLPNPDFIEWPYLNLELLEFIYPRDFERFINVMDEYRIQEYNRELKNLNSQYDLEGFGKEMNSIEKEIANQIEQQRAISK